MNLPGAEEELTGADSLDAIKRIIKLVKTALYREDFLIQFNFNNQFNLTMMIQMRRALKSLIVKLLIAFKLPKINT